MYFFSGDRQKKFMVGKEARALILGEDQGDTVPEGFVCLPPKRKKK